MRRTYFAQRGISLLISLVMLAITLLIAVSAARLALQGEKASRNYRDRETAFQAAEAAIDDAETDIEQSPDTARSRSTIFSAESDLGFSAGCGMNENHRFIGLCLPAVTGEIPVWQAVDFFLMANDARSVPYGKFSGRRLQTGTGMAPSRLPRYIIELIPYNRPGQNAELAGQTFFYRITAIGFGAHENTRVVLQTYYRKEA